MFRIIRPLVVGLALVASSTSLARSQYNYPGGVGYGGYGFGGWTGTVQGSVLRGLGAYAEGAGVYNYDSAVAGSIDTDSYIKLNQYLYASEMEARRRYNRHQAARMNMDRDRFKAYQSRLRDNPTTDDIDTGSALNVLLHQFTDPKIVSGSGATLRMADGKISASAIREISFRDETDAITISLDELTESKNWPASLQADTFTPDREAYQKAVDDALAEDKDGGSIKPQTVKRVRDAVNQLYTKVEATIPKTKQPDHLQAMNYVKGLAGLSRMLDRPNVEAVLAELEKIENTTVGNLVAFMHSYNLRFDAAKTPKQSAAYRTIYKTMLADRDKVIGKPAEENGDDHPATPIENPTAVFHGFDPNYLNPKKGTTAPPPPPSAATAPAPANPTPAPAKP